jgi:hypothetical protein
MTIAYLPLQETAPVIIWDDPRCTPGDTFATWYLKAIWPVLLKSPTLYGKSPSTFTFADRWAITQEVLGIPNPTSYVCKGCGAQHTPQNPLLYGNRQIAEAFGRKEKGKGQYDKVIFNAQEITTTSGDTDFTLIGHHSAAPMIYCLACTLTLSTKVMDHATDNKNLAFWWTPQRSAVPWETPEVLWELPPERPLIFRALSGAGKNHQKWASSIPINWDPNVVLIPLVDDALRGAHWVSIPSTLLATLPTAFLHWQRQECKDHPQRQSKKPDFVTTSSWVYRYLELDSSHWSGRITWNTQAIVKSLNALL